MRTFTVTWADGHGGYNSRVHTFAELAEFAIVQFEELDVMADLQVGQKWKDRTGDEWERIA